MSRNLAAAVEAHLGRPGSITEVVSLSTGYSNQTWLLRGPDLVLRTPPAGKGLLPPYDMRHQHDVLAQVRAHAPGVPVPAVHGWCTDESVLGAPFYLCDFVPGRSFESAVPPWLTDASPEFRHRMCEQWIDAVAALHRAEPLPALGPARSAGATYRWWRDQAAADAEQVTGGATTVALLDEVLDLAPSGPPTPVHGDPKISNTMWLDGRLTALLDWELAFNGEPLCDLGYILNWFPADPRLNDNGLGAYDWVALPGMFSRAEVIDAWQRGTGRQARGIEVYEAAESAKTCAIVLRGLAAHRAGDLDDERMAHWGPVLEIYHERTRQLLDACPATNRNRP